jgi:hypothetical protein
MSDIYKAVANAFAVMGLKTRSAPAIVDLLKAKGVEASDTNGFLSLRQGSTEFNVAECLQAVFKQNPEMFYGHSGEVRYRSDVKDDAAKVKLIREKGYAFWAALPANERSPGAVDVVNPTIISTELTMSQWMTLTPSEKSQAISGWGKDSLANVQRIMARR